MTTPAALYSALFTVTPSDAGGGTEVTGGAYARINLAPTATNWAATNGATLTTNPSTGTSGTTSNNVAITFPTATAAWGTVVAVAIFDAVTGGNMLWWGALTANQVVGIGGTFSFAISQISIQVDN
ncbi:MAG: hypothetical protein ACJ72N_07290 [Labedaea sp.]